MKKLTPGARQGLVAIVYLILAKLKKRDLCGKKKTHDTKNYFLIKETKNFFPIRLTIQAHRFRRLQPRNLKIQFLHQPTWRNKTRFMLCFLHGIKYL